MTLDGPPPEEAMAPTLLGAPPATPTQWPQKRPFSRFREVVVHQRVGASIPRGDPIPPKYGKDGASTVEGSRGDPEHFLDPQSANVQLPTTM